MNKKTLYFLGVVGAVVVVAISIQRGKSPHAEPLSPSAASKPAVRPSVPVSQPPSNIVVRAVETRQADDEMAVEKPSVSAAVRCIIGAETSSADRYLVRSRALESLGDTLSPAETKTLLSYLASTRDPLRPERVAALKNDILNVLRSQKSISPNLAPCLIGMFNAKKHDSAILDYCIQHLGALQEQLDDPAQLDKIVRCIRSASLLDKESYSGTALIAMTHQRNPSDDDKAFLRTRTTAILENSSAHEAARISAMQIASENGYVESLPTLRRVAESAAEPLANRTVAIGALGTFGEASDVALLRKLLAANPNPRLLPALNAAVERIEKREK